jgi:hypothetical protein
MDILLYFGGPALIAFLIQFLVGCRTQHKILRYIPIYCFVITLAFAIIALTSDSGFFLGGNVIAALVWCIIGVCFLIGYALAMLATAPPMAAGAMWCWGPLIYATEFL